MLTGPVLYRSCANKHICGKFMSAVTMSYAEVIVVCHLSHPLALIFFPFLLSCFLSPGGGDVDSVYDRALHC